MHLPTVTLAKQRRYDVLHYTGRQDWGLLFNALTPASSEPIGLLESHVIVTTNLGPSPQEYGLTAGRIQRYKIAASPCSCVCLLTRLEPFAVLPAVREWRNWQTRET